MAMAARMMECDEGRVGIQSLEERAVCSRGGKTISPVCRQSETDSSRSSKARASSSGGSVQPAQSSGCWMHGNTSQRSRAVSKLSLCAVGQPHLHKQQSRKPTRFQQGEVSAATEGPRTHLPLKWVSLGIPFKPG